MVDKKSLEDFLATQHISNVNQIYIVNTIRKMQKAGLDVHKLHTNLRSLILLIRRTGWDIPDRTFLELARYAKEQLDNPSEIPSNTQIKKLEREIRGIDFEIDAGSSGGRPHSPPSGVNISKGDSHGK